MADLEKMLRDLDGPENVEFSSNDYPDYLEEGVHKVTVRSAELKQTANDTPYISITVGNKEGIQRVSLWVHTSTGLTYSIKSVGNIIIHNTAKERRDDIKAELLSTLMSASELWNKVKTDLIGMECWVKVQEVEDSKYPEVSMYGFKPNMKLKADKTSKSSKAEEILECEEIDLSEIPF